MTGASTVRDCPQPDPAIFTELFESPQFEVILFDDRSGRVHRLNGTAGAVWLLCDGAASVDEIVAELAELFAVDETHVRTDVEEVLTDFHALRLLAGDTVRDDDIAHDEGSVADVQTLPRPPDP